jgi:hypothetical protein
MMNNKCRSLFRRAAFLAIVATAVAGCDSGSSNEPVQLGRVTVTVKDDANTPLSGILVNLYASGNTATPWAATTTGANGSAEFSADAGGVKAQSYIARVMTLTNYNFATGETNNKPVTVVAGQTANVTFTLTKKVAGQT